MKCKFCNKPGKNAGGLAAHEKHCKANPNYVKREKSPGAGSFKRGSIPWNKNKTFEENKIKKTIKLIESGDLKSHSNTSVRKHMKRYLIHKKGRVCSICGTSKWNNKPVPLVCDHIDGDHNNVDITNFRLVCCNCDAQLPTYKSKNRGNGDKYFRKYYRKKNNTKGLI